MRRYTSDIKMVTDGTVFVNIANHVYTIQNISQNMTKHEVLSTAFVIYKVAEMTNDKIISLLCLKPPNLLVVTDGTEFVNI